MRTFINTRSLRIPRDFGHIVLILLLFANLPFFTASAQDASRVLVLHDFWEQDSWGLEFDRSFSANLKNSLGRQTQISAQYLGLQQIESSDSLQREKQHIENMILDQDVDLVVTVLPEAADFYLEIEGRFDIPVIFMLPGFESLPEETSTNPFAIVSAVWEESISNTIEEMLALRPETQTIEVFIGNNALDQVYGERVKQVSMNFADRVEFSFQEGMGQERLRLYTQQINEDSLVLILPYSAYGGDQRDGELSFLPDLFELSPVPVFGFSPVNFSSVVGGNITTTESYGVTTAAVAHSILRGEADYLSASAVSSQSFYNWQHVDRWNIPLERLDSPYELLNEPTSLWQEHPVIIVSVINLIVLLSGALLFQSASLRRSKLAHARVSASEKQARESEARYRLLASNTKDVIWTWNIATSSLNYCSPSIQPLLGYTPEEFLATPMIELMTNESANLLKAAISEGSYEAQALEVEYYTKEGSSIWCEIVAQTLPSNSGKPLDWVGVTRDISQRKAADSERQQLEHQMRQSQKMESIGTLAGGIAHDFNNILAVVTGLIDLLKVELTNHREASKLLKNLMAASEKAKLLVRQILTFSRQSSGKRVVTNIPELVQESLGILHAGIPKTIEIKMEIATDSLRVMADPTQIEQVIINLITNAAEASDSSSGEITISVISCHFTAEKEFLYGRVKADDYAVLKVTDRGKGIDPDLLDKIFEPFYTSKELGNGMGMAIVHGIVMDHMGAIDIQSSLGEGTTVSIFLPLTEREDTQTAKPAEVLEEEMESYRIMVIDDEEALLNTIALMLEHLGHECLQFSNPQKALQSLEQESQNLDLIITDYAMPDMTGFELIDYCTENYPSIPVILSTGYSGQIAVQQTAELKDFKVLNKPYKFAELQGVIREAL